jgi:hypothetical protein
MTTQPQDQKTKCSAMIGRGNNPLFVWEHVGTKQQFIEACEKDGYSIYSEITEEDPEDPQAGEILPPMLLDRYWMDCMSWPGDRRSQSENVVFKQGMELAYEQLKPHLKAALPCVEAIARDTRLKEADGGLLLLSATLKELVEYGI